MERKRPILGFILAPLPASILFALGMLVLGMSVETPLELSWQGYLFGTFMWFLHGVVIAYPATLLIGIPGYIIFNKTIVFNLQSYLFGSLILGAISPLLSVGILGLNGALTFEYYIYLTGSIFGALLV